MANVFVTSALILSVAIVGNIISAQTVAVNTDPVIHYTCSSDGSVDTITISTGDFQNIGVLNKDGTLCRPVKQTEASVKTCIKTFKTGNSTNAKVKNITLVYEQERSNRIIGGNGSMYFLLTCEERSAKKIAKAQFSVLGTKTPKVVPLELQEQPSLTINPPKDIHIGDTLTLTMAVGDGYQLKPLVCNAFRTKSYTTPFKIWEYCKIVDSAIVSANLWSPTSNNKQSSLRLDMYAFQFTDSPTVHITCTAMVCPSTDLTTCQTVKVCPTTNGAPDPTRSTTIGSQKIPIPDPQGRRRRSAMDHDKSDSKSSTKSATVSFEIDSAYQSNSSNGICSYWYQYIFAIMMAYWFVKRS